MKRTKTKDTEEKVIQTAPEVEPVEEVKEVEEVKAPEPVDDKNRAIKWKNAGGGTLRLFISGRTRIIKPMEIFSATAYEVPEAFRDSVIPLDKVPEIPKPDKVKGVAAAYEVVPRGKSKSMFDVVDRFGKRINEKPLSKDVANQLKQDLEG